MEASFEIQKFVREIRSGDYESFFRRLQSFFADTPYELVRDLELHYQNVLFIVFKLVGFYVKAEYHTPSKAAFFAFNAARFFPQPKIGVNSQLFQYEGQKSSKL